MRFAASGLFIFCTGGSSAFFLAIAAHLFLITYRIMALTNREFLSSYGGKLAAIAAPFMGALAFVATDPTAAILLTEFLPGPLRLLAILAIAFVAYILPLLTAKKDAKADGAE